jgi:hypothetical protein
MGRETDCEEQEFIKRQLAAVRESATELQAIHERELQAVDTREAVRILFGSYMAPRDPAREATSGFVQMYARLSKQRQ